MSITSANAILMATLPGVFNAPVQIQRFAVDDVYGTEPLHPTETMRGVDGKLSGGMIYSDIKQNFSLMADSPSAFFFDQWYQQQQALVDTFNADMVILLQSLGSQWNMTKGFLVDYVPIPDAKKLLQPLKFAIQWESISKSPV